MTLFLTTLFPKGYKEKSKRRTELNGSIFVISILLKRPFYLLQSGIVFGSFYYFNGIFVLVQGLFLYSWMVYLLKILLVHLVMKVRDTYMLVKSYLFETHKD